jgi:hypothetical protein
VNEQSSEGITKAATSLERAAERLTTIKVKSPVRKWGFRLAVVMLCILLLLGASLALGVAEQVRNLSRKVDTLTCLLLTPAGERMDLATATKCGLR